MEDSQRKNKTQESNEKWIQIGRRQIADELEDMIGELEDENWHSEARMLRILVESIRNDQKLESPI